MTITELEPRIQTAAVTVYTKKPCFGCDKTKEKLDEAGVEYIAIDIQKDAAAFRYVTETLGLTQAPVVVVSTLDEDVVWSGLQPQMIKKHITHRADVA